MSPKWKLTREEALAQARFSGQIRLTDEELGIVEKPVSFEEMTQYIEKYAEQGHWTASQQVEHLTISLLNGIVFTVTFPASGLKPAKLIHVEFYQFNEKSEAKWEMRENGSICNNANILATYPLTDYPTEESALVEARAYVETVRAGL